MTAVAFKVLFIVADTNLRHLIAKELSDGFEFVYAANGEEAVSMAMHELPDLILIDSPLPGIDGCQVFQQLQQQTATSHTPTLFFVEDHEINYLARECGDGNYDFIVKPIIPASLCVRVENLLRQQKSWARCQEEIMALQARQKHLDELLMGQSQELKQAYRRIEQIQSVSNTAALQPNDADTAKPSILIVDDVPENIRILRSELSTRYQIYFATSAEEALTRAAENPIDLILMDIILPGMDGYEACRQLQSNPKTAEIPLIFITSKDQETDETLGLALGAADYITKPFSLPVVRSRVDAIIRLKKEMDQRLALARQLERLNTQLEKKVQARVSDLEKAHEALRQEEKKYRNIFENAQEGIFQTTVAGRIVNANPAMVQLLDYDSVEDLKSQVQDVAKQVYHSPHDRERIISRLQTFGKVTGYTLRLQRKNGSAVWCEMNIKAIRNTEGQIEHFEGSVQDITRQRIAEKEKQQIERQLLQSQKMEAVGTLAGGIAHDFNNILSAIMGYTEITLLTPTDKDTVCENLEKVLNAGERAKTLIRQILDFSRQTKAERVPIDMKVIVMEALKLLRASLPASIEIQTSLDIQAEVMADPTQIHQVVMNLGTNAAQAMGSQKGTLSVSLDLFEVTEPSQQGFSNLAIGKYVKMSIHDTGPGIPEELIDRIFDPFFTTKANNQGTGMGLAVVHGIIDGLGGEINVQSDPSKGTVFAVYLPRQEPQHGSQAAEAIILKGGAERILVVDDESSQVDIIKIFLESLGYRVDMETDSRRALETFGKSPARYDLLITDMTMPKLTGDELAARVLQVRPDIPVIVTTGYSELLTEERVQDIGIRDVVIKPVARHQLAQVVRNVLDGQADN